MFIRYKTNSHQDARILGPLTEDMAVSFAMRIVAGAPLGSLESLEMLDYDPRGLEIPKLDLRHNNSLRKLQLGDYVEIVGKVVKAGDGIDGTRFAQIAFLEGHAELYLQTPPEEEST